MTTLIGYCLSCRKIRPLVTIRLMGALAHGLCEECEEAAAAERLTGRSR